MRQSEHAQSAKKPRATKRIEMTLNVRRLRLALSPTKYQTEADSTYLHSLLQFDPNTSALLVIDPWADFVNEGWLQRAQENMREYLRPLIRTARVNAIRVIYLPSEREISSVVAPEHGDIVIRGMNCCDELEEELQSRTVKTLFYSGYSANICLLEKPGGVRRMYERTPFRNFILVRDATIGFELPETLEGEWLKKAAIFTFEYYFGSSTTVADFMGAFDGVKTMNEISARNTCSNLV
jgi:hypothetical protein